MDESQPVDGETVFNGLGLSTALVKTLTELGYEEPTPVQRESIPHLISGRDLVGQAATGTGKTAAFALPILQGLSEKPKNRPRPSSLVLVPTRELAMQVAQAIHRYGRKIGVEVLPIYGGQPYGPQLKALERGVDVVVATPGRALDHIGRNTLNLSGVATVVLDEADEMLDMGFAEDIVAILDALPEKRQTVLFSATFPSRIATIARRYLRDPVEIKVAKERVSTDSVPKVRQTAYIVPKSAKLAALGRVLDLETPTQAIVFCRRRNEVDELAEALNGRGYRAEALHGGMSQEQRDRVMKKFRGGNAELLIATDVAARGLDIEQLSHVVNYDVPSEPESYVHRIGRVGRAGREGVAITLAEPREHPQIRQIERATKRKIEISQVPTVADLRERRQELTRAAFQEAILEGGLDEFRAIVESLAAEHDIMEVALAGVKLVSQSDVESEPEIPSFERFDTGRDPRERAGRERGGRPKGKPERGPRHTGPMVRLFVGAGRNSGIQPRDLVGAIAGESGIPGRVIGAIEIGDKFSIVEVPEEMAITVVQAMKRSKLKGKKVVVRPDIRDY